MRPIRSIHLFGSAHLLRFTPRSTLLGLARCSSCICTNPKIRCRAVDSIKDRLASFYHWDDRQGLEQAINICQEVENAYFDEIEKWSEREGHMDKFQIFLEKLHKPD
ncbi:hypothetical protein SCG7109_AQ_00030 [Chlamydiales bacterium SCGC AG-110-M15]|nr:hypothetical protein SCG7109_AQ_00030 [Chlamydiales bacterium SCGC AG-110-M15]